MPPGLTLRINRPSSLQPWTAWLMLAGITTFSLAFSLNATSLAQTPQPHDHAGHEHAAQQEVVVPQSPEFVAASDALREHLKKMRAVMVYYHLSESPAKDRELKQRWRELVEQGDELHGKMVDAALAEYQANPKVRSDLAGMLFRLLKRNVDEDRYDGMLPVAQALLENNYQPAELTKLIALTAFATSEFEVARPFLGRLVEAQEISPELGLVLENYELVEDAWQKELELRAADAQGEPLPRVLIKTTKGDIEVELFENQAPETVANFIHLAEQGFYNDLTFHRVLEHFMAQGGCPQGDGQGGPGYFIRDEAGKPNARKFFRGTLGMALTQNPDSAGSQFFITFLPTPQLNGSFTAFGRVLSGLDVLSNLNRINPEKKDKDAPPVMPDEILEIEVLFKRDHEYKPNKVSP